MIQYLTQVTIYTGAMLLLYYLLLRDKPLHRFSRMYLLSAAVLPLVLPLLKLPQPLRPHQEAAPLVVMLQEVTVGDSPAQQVPFWLWLISGLYLVVTTGILVVKLISYVKMRRVISNSTKEQYDGYTILKHTGYGPGSWGKYIFLPDGDVDETIIKHERAHIQLRHSRDIIFISIMQAVLWPNIFIHFLKKELVQVHEFQADAAVGITGEAYTKLLLSSVFGACTLPFTHSFIIHPIKRRIMMLHNNRKNGKSRGVLASVFALALLTGIVTMQSCEQREEKESMLIEAKVTKAGDSIFAFVHKMPNPGYNVNEKLGNLIEYPEEAKENKIEGRVPVKFVVGKDGKISGIHVIGKNVDPLLADAAIKAIAQLPDWQPGEDEQGNKVAVYFTLPVNFKLDKDDKKTSFRELTDAEFKVGMQQMQRDLAAMRPAGYEPKELDRSDPRAQEVLGEIHSLLSDALNPVVVNPPIMKFTMENKGMTPDEVITALEGDGLEVTEVRPGTDEHTAQAQNFRKAKLRLGSHNGYTVRQTEDE